MEKRMKITLEKIILNKLHNIRARKFKKVNKTVSFNAVNSAILDEKLQFWTQTPLREFGYKCIENKHELCKGCKCLCHHVNTSKN